VGGVNIRRGGVNIRRGGVNIRRRGVVLAHAAKTPQSFCYMSAGFACQERCACIHLQTYKELAHICVHCKKRLAVFTAPAWMYSTVQ
jgi:hypothetical protein